MLVRGRDGFDEVRGILKFVKQETARRHKTDRIMADHHCRHWKNFGIRGGAGYEYGTVHSCLLLVLWYLYTC